MFEIGWKKKAERLRMTLLSAGHQLAKELPPDIARIMKLFRDAHETKDASALLVEVVRPPPPDLPRILWEPMAHYGWDIKATMYLQNGQLWWLIHATRKNEQPPREKDVVFLDKILTHLGADLDRDTIIGPRSSPDGEPPLPFGWWTWFNRMDLYEIQTKGHGSDASIRVVPLDSPQVDGYARIDLSEKSPSTECTCSNPRRSP